jgi:phosphoglycerol transferase MdoB-like AlkP superfamily enzyme
VNVVDTGYYPFSNKRSGTEIFSMGSDIMQQATAYLASYWYLLVILLLMIWMCSLLYPHLDRANTVRSSSLAKQGIVAVIVAALAFLGARGGWQIKPVTPFDAARFADVRLLSLTINTPFQMIISSQQTGVEEKKYFTEETARAIFNPVQPGFGPSTDSTWPNIVLIIMESMGKEYVGYYNKGRGFTPFLDSLLKQSIVYTHAYANGKRSIEGIPAIIASMPSLMDKDYNSTIYQSNKLRGIGSYLQDIGYDASFYHGGINGTMSFNNFVAVTNSGNYFGKNEYTGSADDDDRHWGIYDAPYLSYVAAELGKKKVPFFSTIFTLSAHHPYKIPAHDALMLKPGTLPIHRSIRYSDLALRRFFTEASKTDWFSKTVFIITADHSAENETPYYQTAQGRYEIPLAVYFPGREVEHREETVTMQHADILPFILFNIGYPSPWFSFGTGTGVNGFAIQYFDHIYQVIHWPFVYHFDGEKSAGFFDLRTDPLMRTDLKGKGMSEELHLDSLIKSVVQQYNHALITNTTIPR